MHALEAIALKEKYKPPTKTTTMYRSFARSIEQNGRIYEFGFMLEYFLKTNPFAALKMLPMAFSLLTHKRMPLLPKAVEGRHELNRMFRNITTGGYR
ncbi:MAG: hypothetical protein NT177_06455 [Chloroflexi bacterium]|nr:hypothetical protein [Chloroflexota bacterium]